MPDRLTVYVSSCDGYSDCWGPFFRLFARYWPDFSGRIFLGTEYRDCAVDGLPVTAQQVCRRRAVPASVRVPWSQFTRWALEDIDADIILFMQEDFFLRGSVQTGQIDRLLNLMEMQPEIACIHLTDQGVLSEGPSTFENLDVVRLRQRYRVSCQCALWRKQELLSILRDDESAAEFEEFGSRRSAASGHLYLAVNKDFVCKDRYEIVPYVFTGIIQGRWNREVVSLFAENGIDVDYSARGFTDDPRPPKTLGRKLAYQWRHLKLFLRNEYDLRIRPQRTA